MASPHPLLITDGLFTDCMTHIAMQPTAPRGATASLLKPATAAPQPSRERGRSLATAAGGLDAEALLEKEQGQAPQGGRRTAADASSAWRRQTPPLPPPGVRRQTERQTPPGRRSLPHSDRRLLCGGSRGLRPASSSPGPTRGVCGEAKRALRLTANGAEPARPVVRRSGRGCRAEWEGRPVAGRRAPPQRGSRCGLQRASLCSGTAYSTSMCRLVKRTARRGRRTRDGSFHGPARNGGPAQAAARLHLCSCPAGETSHTGGYGVGARLISPGQRT